MHCSQILLDTEGVIVVNILKVPPYILADSERIEHGLRGRAASLPLAPMGG